MRMRARAVVASAAVLLAACGLLAGCGQEPAQPSSPAAPVAPAPSAPVSPEPDAGDESVDLSGSPQVEKIKQHGRLMVGLPSDDPVMAAHDDAGGHSGFDVEFARILASRIGLRPEQVSFRWLPASMRVDATRSGSVDIQLGGFDPASSLEKIGPYVVTGSPGQEQERFLGIKSGDEAMRKQIQGIVDGAIADGSWQRAYDATLGKAGVPARPR